MKSSPTSLLAEKQALREQMRAQRNALGADEVAERSRAVAARLLLLPEIHKAGAIFVYLSYKNEVDTHGLVIKWLAAGKRVCVPAFDAARRCYRPCELHDFDRDLVAGKLGILEPREAMSCAEPADAAIVPGLAFDARGHRLGYGKGYYDRMLAMFGGVKIGLALDFQMQPAVPVGASDVTLDIVVSESEVYRRTQ